MAHTEGEIDMTIRGTVTTTAATAGLIVSALLFAVPFGTTAQAGEVTLYTSMPKKAAIKTIAAYKKLAPGAISSQSSRLSSAPARPGPTW
jgi:hypothetical protein